MSREFVERREDEASYDEFLPGKVEVARSELRAGKAIPAMEVEREFAARRAQQLRRAVAPDRRNIRD
jgi:hypothetical protein